MTIRSFGAKRGGGPATMQRYYDSDSGLGHEGAGRRSDVKVADLPEQEKSFAIDDRAAVESPSVVANGDLDADAGTTDDMHDNMSALSSVESTLHCVAKQLIGHRQHGFSCVVGQIPSKLN
jgi:hypothetical protein